MKKTILTLLAVLIISTGLTACSRTIEGLGRDMQRAGERIADSMKER